MSNDFAVIFNELREKAGFKNVSQLAQVSGVSQATLSRLQSGRGQPSPDTLRKLSPFLNVGYEELMRLAGHLRDEDLFEPVAWDEEYEVIEVPVLKDYYMIPKRSELIGVEAVPPRYRGCSYVYIEVQDNSMSNAGINKDDLVLVRMDVPLDNGDIAAVSILEDSVIFRRYFRSRDRIILFSECRDGRTEEHDVRDVQILGKVVRLVRTLE